MKKLIVAIMLLLFIIPFNIKAEEKINIYLFHGQECPHCEAEREYLKDLEASNPDVKVYYYEVWHNKVNESVMHNLKRALGYATKDINSVPFTIIGDYNSIGFASYKIPELEDAMDAYTSDNQGVLDIINGLEPDKIEVDKTGSSIKNLPILGKVDVKKVSLPLITIVLGTLDGFNPCAMWVLLFLISMLLGMKDKKRMWILGISFLVTSALVYLFVMLSWISITTTFATVRWLQVLIGMAALVGAYVNYKSYEKQKLDGCVVIDDKKRKKIFSQIKTFTTEKSFVLALVGVITLALSVNIIELACSAGFPLLFSQILSLNNLGTTEVVSYTLLYVLFFLLDDLIVFTIAMVSLKMTGISTKYSKYSHLIGAILMAIIGTLLILRPELIMFNF